MTIFDNSNPVIILLKNKIKEWENEKVHSKEICETQIKALNEALDKLQTL